MALSFIFWNSGSPIGTPKKPGGSVGAIEFSSSIGLHALELGWVQSRARDRIHMRGHQIHGRGTRSFAEACMRRILLT